MAQRFIDHGDMAQMWGLEASDKDKTIKFALNAGQRRILGCKIQLSLWALSRMGCNQPVADID